MPSRIRNFLLSELIYILAAPTLVMLGIVIYGILFDYWYKDLYNIFLVSILVYFLLVFIRFTGWIAKKIRK